MNISNKLFWLYTVGYALGTTTVFYRLLTHDESLKVIGMILYSLGAAAAILKVMISLLCDREHKRFRKAVYGEGD